MILELYDINKGNNDMLGKVYFASGFFTPEQREEEERVKTKLR